MSLAQTLQNSIETKKKQEQEKKIDTKQNTNDKILAIMRETQLKIWRLMIEQKINEGQADIRLSLRQKNNTHVYLNKYEYQTNLNLLILSKEGKKFVDWLHSNGLKYTITDDDDGMGYESWQNLKITVS